MEIDIMIQSRSDYHDYIQEDMHHFFQHKPTIIERKKNPTWCYQRLLRRCLTI